MCMLYIIRKGFTLVQLDHCTFKAKVPTTLVVNLSMMWSIYLILKKKHKEIDAIIIYACIDLILVEMSPAGAFL